LAGRLRGHAARGRITSDSIGAGTGSHGGRCLSRQDSTPAFGIAVVPRKQGLQTCNGGETLWQNLGIISL
jgi:hypothetical protein